VSEPLQRPLPPRQIDRSQHELLVVNDDPVGRYATVRLLRAAGFPTVEAASGMEALALAGEHMSAIVLDIHLPDIDGLEVCRRLRRQPHTFKLPVIHLTAAFLTDEDKVRGLDSGADAYLTHPVEPAVLVSTILALVRTREAEDAMRRSEAKFRAAFERAPSGIALVRVPGGAMLEINAAMAALLGCREEAVVGRPLQDFVLPEDAADAEALLAPDADAAGPREFGLRRSDGQCVTVEWTAAAYPDPDVVMLVATDVSQRRQLALQRQELLERERRARGDAERHSRLKDDLIAVLSHELRTPLNVIMNWVHVLQRGGQPDLMARGLAAIERNAVLQARLISDILDMSRLNLGKLPLNIESVAIGSVIEATVATMQPQLQASHHRLRLDLQGESFRIQADEARIQQVLWNLIGNAAKFSPSGSEITLSLRIEDGGARIAVRDRGQGIPVEFLPHVFDRFAQSDAASNRQHGGLGLGLSIVKHLVEAHGGQVSARSAGAGQGAEFIVWLPGEQAEPAEPDGGAASAFGGLGGAGEALDGQRVLLVEDDAEAGAMLTMILGEQGAAVRHVTGVDAALQCLQAATFDLLISDIGMPGRDGYELIRELRRGEGAGPRLPAIALTAFSREADRAAALAAGFDVHLGKPLRPQLLLAQIQRLLGLPR
jgi:PAS domain S-box-containing protein